MIIKIVLASAVSIAALLWLCRVLANRSKLYSEVLYEAGDWSEFIKEYRIYSLPLAEKPRQYVTNTCGPGWVLLVAGKKTLDDGSQARYVTFVKPHAHVCVRMGDSLSNTTSYGMSLFTTAEKYGIAYHDVPVTKMHILCLDVANVPDDVKEVEKLSRQSLLTAPEVGHVHV